MRVFFRNQATMGPVCWWATLSVVIYATSIEATVVEIKKLGTPITLNCTEEEVSGLSFSHWVLNDLTVLREGESTGVFDIPSTSPIAQLRVAAVERHTLGDYFCVLARPAAGGSERLFYFKTELMSGQKSSWELYRTQTIVGIVAAIICAIVLVGLCLVWKYRWRDDADKDVRGLHAGYDTADAARRDYYPEKATRADEGANGADVGFANDAYVNTHPTSTHGVVTEHDTQF